MKAVSFNKGWYQASGVGGEIMFPGMPFTPPVAVTLPHDISVHQKRTPDALNGNYNGFYPSGVYHYTKKFDVPADWAEKCVTLEFEGVYMHAMVFLNGSYVGQGTNGYTAFSMELNNLLKFGEENEIKVTLYTDEDSRWYVGAGIYRNVNLYVADKLHIAKDGFRLTTTSINRGVATLTADITVENRGFTARDVKVAVDLIDADGNVACHDIQKLHITGNTTEELHPRLYVKDAKLWNLDDPNLYTVNAYILEGDTVIDESVIPTFGIRVLSLDNVNGLCINGETVKLYGGCIHHDNGIIGAATVERAEERRVQILKSAGYNAIRSAHNPTSTALLKACDKYGVAVMDELSDMWFESKRDKDYSHSFAVTWKTDVQSLVAKDYNHPSVIMYSTGNEIPEIGKAPGARTCREIGNYIRSLDPTRYITAGINNMLASNEITADMMPNMLAPVDALNAEMADPTSNMSKANLHPGVIEATNEAYESMDICGYNYAADRYLNDEKLFTNWISVGSETFPKDLAYNWNLVKNVSSVIGDFSWTSWDYMGEAGIGKDTYLKKREFGFGGRFPWFVAYDADFDITGRQTPQGYYREIVIDHRTEPYLAIQDPAHYEDVPIITGWSWPGSVSSWNLPGFEGKPVRVDVYGKGDEAELLINGESQGRLPIPHTSKSMDVAYRVEFDTVYQPGKVEAVIYKDGAEVGRYAVETADDAVSLRVAADRDEIFATDTDLAYIDIDLVDAQGRLNPGVVKKVSVAVEGAGELMGLGSANPCGEDDFFGTSCSTFYGHALAAVRPTCAGEIRVTVSAEGCDPVTVTVNAK